MSELSLEDMVEIQKGITCCGKRDFKDSAGCPACKTCEHCGKFLGCFNLAGYRTRAQIEEFNERLRRVETT